MQLCMETYRTIRKIIVLQLERGMMEIWFTGIIAPRGNMFACEYIDQV